MPFGILIHTHRVLIRGMINLLLDNLRITVITNPLLELVQVFTLKVTTYRDYDF